MKFPRILLMTLALICSVSAHAAVAFVKCAENAGTTNSVSFTPTNTGDMLLAFSATSAGGGSPTATASDNLSDTWTSVQATVHSGALYMTEYVLPNNPAGITTVTFTYNGGTPGQADLAVCEVSGAATSSPVSAHIAQGQSDPGTATNAITSGLTTASGYIFGMEVPGAPHSTLVSGTGYTQRFQGGTLGTTAEDVTQATSASYAATFTDATNGATNSYSTFMTAISAASVTVTPHPVLSNGHPLISNGHPVD